MRGYNTRLSSFLFACLCSVLMTTMLLSVSYNDTAGWGTRNGFGNSPNSIPTRRMLIEMGLFRDGKIGNGNQLKPRIQSESCQKNCNLSLPISTSGKLPTWATRNLLNNTKKSKHTAFRQTISLLQYRKLIELLAIFRNICEKNNLMYMLYGGTLLGAYRHFGFIPWDDDVDVFVNSSDRLLLKNVLGRVPGFSLHAPPGRQWKLFKTAASIDSSTSKFESRNVDARRNIETPRIEKDSTLLKTKNRIAIDLNSTHNNDDVHSDVLYGHTERPYQFPKTSLWPYIDIFFFDENSTHIWDDNPSYSAIYCFYKNDVFPLKSMRFENSLYPVPRHTRTFLDNSYNVDLCVTSTYSHKHEVQSRQRQVSLPCRRLFKYFPFVFRFCGRGYSFEQLVIADRSLYEVLLKC